MLHPYDPGPALLVPVTSAPCIMLPFEPVGGTIGSVQQFGPFRELFGGSGFFVAVFFPVLADSRPVRVAVAGPDATVSGAGGGSPPSHAASARITFVVTSPLYNPSFESLDLIWSSCVGFPSI